MSSSKGDTTTKTTALIRRLRAACEEIRSREVEELADMDDPNCYGAGWSAGAMATADELLACLDEECQGQPT